MARRGAKGSKWWPYYAQLAAKLGIAADPEELQRKWKASEKRRVRRYERREGKNELRREE